MCFIALCGGGQAVAAEAAAQLAAACDADGGGASHAADAMAVEAACATGPRAAPGVPLGAATVCASRLRGARFSLLAPDAADVLGCLDAASVADVVVFVQRVAPTRGGDSGEGTSGRGRGIDSTSRAQGPPGLVFLLVRDQI